MSSPLIVDEFRIELWCTCCGANLPSRNHLKNHLIVHCAQLICPVCKDRFYDISPLVDHLEEHLPPEMRDAPNANTGAVTRPHLPEPTDTVVAFKCLNCNIPIDTILMHVEQFHMNLYIELPDIKQILYDPFTGFVSTCMVEKCILSKVRVIIAKGTGQLFGAAYEVDPPPPSFGPFQRAEKKVQTKWIKSKCKEIYGAHLKLLLKKVKENPAQVAKLMGNRAGTGALIEPMDINVIPAEFSNSPLRIEHILFSADRDIFEFIPRPRLASFDDLDNFSVISSSDDPGAQHKHFDAYDVSMNPSRKYYCCKFCNSGFRAMRQYEGHLSECAEAAASTPTVRVVHLEKLADPYVCPICQDTFTALNIFNKHIRLHVPGLEESDMEQGMDEGMDVDPGRQGDPTTSRGGADRHIDDPFAAGDPSCPDTPPLPGRGPHRGGGDADYSSRPPLLPTPTSAVQAPQLSAEDFTCPLCGKELLTIKAVGKHMGAAHGIPPPFICDICQMPATTYEIFILHTRSHKENRKRPYPGN